MMPSCCRNAGLVLLLALAPSLTGCAALKKSAVKGQVTKTMQALNPPGSETVRLADDLYTFRWLGWRTAFVTTPDGVIVFDPLNPVAARELAGEIRRVAPNPAIRYVIYSHNHRDHVSGAAELGGSPIIVAHADAASALHSADIARPTEVFSEPTHDVTLGSTTIKLVRLPNAHGEGMIASLIPHRRSLFVVDVVQTRQIPSGAAFLHAHEQRRALQQLAALDFETLIPGHRALGTKKDLLDSIAFFDDLSKAVEVSARAHRLYPIGNEQLMEAQLPEVGDLLYDVQEQLRPKYGQWSLFEEASLQAAMWQFTNGLVLAD